MRQVLRSREAPEAAFEVYVKTPGVPPTDLRVRVFPPNRLLVEVGTVWLPFLTSFVFRCFGRAAHRPARARLPARLAAGGGAGLGTWAAAAE